MISDNIDDGTTVEIYCDDASHDKWLVGVFEFADDSWGYLDRDGLDYRGYFDSEDGQNPLKGVQNAIQLLYDDAYIRRDGLTVDQVHPGNYTRTRYKFTCRECGRVRGRARNVISKQPEKVHAIIGTAARCGVSELSLSGLAGRRDNASDRRPGGLTQRP